MKQLYFFAALLILMASCQIEEPETVEIFGKKPVYLLKSELGSISNEAPRMFDMLGKIVARGAYIYINERFEGIHVINNSDPENPRTEHFWSIPGNIDFTLQDNFLYADNSFDLYTIDISDPANIQLVFVNKDIYGPDGKGEKFPSDYSGSFECTDPTIGVVIDWEYVLLTDPKCFR